MWVIHYVYDGRENLKERMCNGECMVFGRDGFGLMVTANDWRILAT